MCIITIIAALVSLTCPTPPQDAAQTLASSPALSNRTHVYTLRPEDLRPRVTVAPNPIAPQAVQSRESEARRANRMGIPGGWTPLEWAILHSSGGK
jgi:hypothetical protein